MTHYKWYDNKHVHTTYIKQLSNNTKQTDKTKRSRKKKQTRTKGKQNKTKRQEQKPAPTHPPTRKNKKKQQSIHDVDDIQVIHTNLSTVTSEEYELGLLRSNHLSNAGIKHGF